MADGTMRAVAGRARRAGALFSAISVVVALFTALVSLRIAYATFSTAATASGSALTATIQPPTSVAASASRTAVTLTWTPSVSSRITGYQVMRRLNGEAGYSLVATIASPSATGYTDSVVVYDPASYYVMSYVASWTSAASNTVTVEYTYVTAVTTTSGLVSYWRLGTGTTSTSVPDSFGTNNGTATGGFTPGVTGAISGDTAATFNGTNAYVTIGNPTNLQLNTGSVEVWFNTASAGTAYRDLVSKEGVYYFGFNNNILGVYDDGGGAFRSTGVDPTNATWRHVVLTYQSGVTNGTKIYLDGSLVLTTTLTAVGQTKPVALGAWVGGGPAEYFAGTMDEVSIYNVVLSAATVTDHYLAR